MMSLSKLWLFFLTFLTGMLFLALLLSPAHVQRTLEETTNTKLTLAHQSANLLLQNSARKWIDTAAQLAGDAVIRSSLEELYRGQAELDVLHKTVQKHIKEINGTLKVSLVILTDARGRVLARVGKDEDVYKDSIEGYPLVADAARGYRMDDLWYLQGTLYRMAAAPVVASTHTDYVGAILLGQAITNELAQQIQTAIGMDTVIMCAGRVLASSRPPGMVPDIALARLIEEQAEFLARGGHTQPIPIGDDKAFVALLAGLPGEAATHGAALVLLGQGVEEASLMSLLSSIVDVASGSDFFDKQLAPLSLGILAAFLGFLAGLALLRSEAEGPYGVLIAEVRNIARRRIMKVGEKQFTSYWRELALAINAALRAVRSSAQADSGEVSAEDLFGADGGEDAEEAAEPGPAGPELPEAGPAVGAEHPAAEFPQPAPFSGAQPELAQPEPAPSVTPSAATVPLAPSSPFMALIRPKIQLKEQVPEANGEPAAPRSGSSPERPALSSLATPRRIGGGPRPFPELEPLVPKRPDLAPEPLPPPEAPEVAASARTWLDPAMEQLGAEDMPEMATMRDIPQSVVQEAIESALLAAPAAFTAPARPAPPPRAVPPPLPRMAIPQKPAAPAPVAASEKSPSPPLSPPRPPSIFEEETAVPGSSRSSPPPETEEELDARFRQTYEEFIVTKRRCQEPVEGLTFEKFAVKLRQSREQIMRQHACKRVRFHVYVKDGKAALKATPVAR